MTEGEPMTGEDAVSDRNAPGPTPQDESGADESRDETPPPLADDEDVPRCQLRRCRKVFPPALLAGTGRPREFCPPELTTWGSKKRTCAELGKHERLYIEVFGEQAVVGDLDVERLAAAITALLGPVAGLHAQLGGVAGQLDDAVATAAADLARMRAEVAAALAQAEADARLRTTAEKQATEAIQRQIAAERAARTAAAAREAAQLAQRKAEQDQARAEGERDQHQGRADRAEQAADLARARLDEAAQANAALSAQVQHLTTLLEQATARAEDERRRADAAVAETDRVRADAQAKLDAMRAAADERIQQARADADTTVRAAREETARQAEEHQATLERLGRDHARALADSARHAAAAEGELERLRQRVHDRLTGLLRTATTPPADPDQDDDPIQQLHRAATAQAELRHGIEDLTRDLDP